MIVGGYPRYNAGRCLDTLALSRKTPVRPVKPLFVP